MRRTVSSLKRHLDNAVGDRKDAWLATVFIDYEGRIDFSAPEWMEIWHDDTLTVYRNVTTGESAGGIKYRKKLTPEQKVWL